MTAAARTRPSGSAMVSTVATAPDCDVTPTVPIVRRPVPAALDVLPPKPVSIQTDALVCEFPDLKRRGFSNEVLERMPLVHAPATNKVYRSQWRLFESWCKSRDFDPLTATSVLVADFLVYLFKERKIQARSIEGYRSAIAFHLKRSTGYDLSDCSVLSDLVRGFKRERPPRPRLQVNWDLSVVLRFLRSAQFAPDVITAK